MCKEFFSTLFLLASFLLVGSRTQAREENRGHRTQGAANVFNVSVPAHPFDLILARPEKNSATLSVLA